MRLTSSRFRVFGLIGLLLSTTGSAGSSETPELGSSLPPIREIDHSQSESPNQTSFVTDNETAFPHRGDTAVIRLVVGYTKAVADSLGSDLNVRNLLTNAVVQTNQGFRNSGIKALVELAIVLRTGDTSDPYFPADYLKQLFGTIYNDVTFARDSLSCDVAFILASTKNRTTQSTFDVNDANGSLGIIDFHNLLQKFVFARELGVMMGARDWADSAQTTPYRYAHGFVTGNFCTIMTNNCPAGKTQINFWSSPFLRVNNQRLGTFRNNDCVRLASVRTQFLAGLRSTNPGIWRFNNGSFSQISANFSPVDFAAVVDTLYQLTTNGGMIAKSVCPSWQNNCSWQNINQHPFSIAIAAARSGIYRISDSGTVSKYNGSPYYWARVDTNRSIKSLSASTSNLFQLQETGTIRKYASGAWTAFTTDSTNKSINVTDNYIYRATWNNTLYRSPTSQPTWVKIFDPAFLPGPRLAPLQFRQVATTHSSVFLLTSDDSLRRFDGTSRWITIPSPQNAKPILIAAGGSPEKPILYATTQAGALFRMRLVCGLPQCPWEKIGDATGATGLHADGEVLYVLRSN